MYYSVKSGEGKGKLDTTVSAASPFEAAQEAIRKYRPTSLGMIIEVVGDDDTHYCLTTNVLKAMGETIENCDA